MTSLHPCKHCNGTTFCSATRDATGKLKTRPACVCCVVRAGLDPKAVYDKVICSVCEGKGIVEPAQEAPAAKRQPYEWYWWVVVPLLLASLAFFVFSALSYYREQHKYDDARDVMVQKTDETSATRKLPRSTVQGIVKNGMTKESVRSQLGEPTFVVTEAIDAEEWGYRCKDGDLRITFANDVVRGVR
jgi:hypothetical protein